MDDIARRALLFDFYGSLLTPKQLEIYDLYYQQDLSLGEIADIQKVSRQAVFDLLKRTQEALNLYEKRLGLVKIYLENCQIIRQIKQELDTINEKSSLKNEVETIRQLLDKLENNW